MDKKATLIVIGLSVILVAVYLAYSPAGNRNSINSFEECRDAGYPVMESYPEKCRTPEGELFVRDISGDGLNTSNWIEIQDKDSGIRYKYPENISSSPYFEVSGWPPEAFVSNTQYSCDISGGGDEYHEKSYEKIINGRSYCITEKNGAAAGSRYELYEYSSGWQDQTLAFTFSLRFPECRNYSEPEQSDCLTAQGDFDMGVVDMIISGVRESVKEVSITGEEDSVSGIKGTALAGPQCPVIEANSDQDCDDKPISIDLVVLREGSQDIVTQFKTEDDGSFKIKVLPGQYRIFSNNENSLPVCSSSLINVTSGKFTDIVVICDTGIR